MKSQAVKKSIVAAVMLGVMGLSGVCFAEPLHCVLTDHVEPSGKPGDAKNLFSFTTPMIYLVCDSDQLKKGQELKSVWFADNTNQVAPDNYKIDQSVLAVENEIPENQVFLATFSLSKPKDNWPVGNYHVDVYIDKSLENSIKFSVEDIK